MDTEPDEYPHIHIAILTTGVVRWELSAYLLHLMANERRTEYSISYYTAEGEGRPVDSNRNRICRDRPEGSALLMLDEDVVPAPQLFDVVLMGHDVVVCPCPIWNEAADPPIQINLEGVDAGQTVFEVGADMVAEIKAGGAAALFLSPDVIDHPAMRGAFRFPRDDWGVTSGDPDHAFCAAAQEAGFTIHAALRYPCGHVQAVNLRTVYERMMPRVAVE